MHTFSGNCSSFVSCSNSTCFLSREMMLIPILRSIVIRVRFCHAFGKMQGATHAYSAGPRTVKQTNIQHHIWNDIER